MAAAGIRAHFPAKRPLPETLAKKIKQALVSFVSGTFSSFNIVENEHLHKFADVMMEIGSKTGRVAAKDILYGRKTVRKATLETVEEIQENNREAIKIPAKVGAVAFVTDMWSHKLVQNSYLELSFFGWKKAVMTAARGSFGEGCITANALIGRKLAKILRQQLILSYWTLVLRLKRYRLRSIKGPIFKQRPTQSFGWIVPAIRLHTAIEKAWGDSKDAEIDLRELDVQCHRLVEFVKKSGGIQYKLNITLKQGGTTRPWRALIKMLDSIWSNINDSDGILAEELRRKRKEGYLSDIDADLLGAVRKVLGCAETVFDLLEAAEVPNLPSVLPPGYYLLRNNWYSFQAFEFPAVITLKQNLVAALDAKVWTSIVSIHFAASYLDPTLKQFLFAPEQDRCIFLTQAASCIKAFCRPTSALFNNSDDDHAEFAETEPTRQGESEPGPSFAQAKARKADPFAAFRTMQSTQSRNERLDVWEMTNQEFSMAVEAELNQYAVLDVPVHVDVPFDCLAWWGKEQYRFPSLANAARQILVVQGSSSESERNFSTGGRVTRKERARLAPTTIEAQMILAEGLKKRLISWTQI